MGRTPATINIKICFDSTPCIHFWWGLLHDYCIPLLPQRCFLASTSPLGLLTVVLCASSVPAGDTPRSQCLPSLHLVKSSFYEPASNTFFSVCRLKVIVDGQQPRPEPLLTQHLQITSNMTSATTTTTTTTTEPCLAHRSPLLALPDELKLMIVNQLRKAPSLVALLALRSTHSTFQNIIPAINSSDLRRNSRGWQFKRAEKHLPALFPLNQYPCYVCCRVKHESDYQQDVKGGFAKSLTGRYLEIGDADSHHRACDDCHLRWEGKQSFRSAREEWKYERYREIVTKPEDLVCAKCGGYLSVVCYDCASRELLFCAYRTMRRLAR